MKTIEFDTEKRAIMTETRVNLVLLYRGMGKEPDWEFIEQEVKGAVWELKMDRLLEPFRELGRTSQQVMDYFFKFLGEHND